MFCKMARYSVFGKLDPRLRGDDKGSGDDKDMRGGKKSLDGDAFGRLAMKKRMTKRVYNVI